MLPDRKPGDRETHPGPPDPDESSPGVAIRRHTDRCFFAAEEAVHGPAGELAGYVVEGVLIPVDDIAETRAVPGDAACGGPR